MSGSIYDAAVPENQVQSSLVVALAAEGIADLDRLLSRKKLHAPAASFNRRMLGVQLDEPTVSEVLDDSVAQKGGMKGGDVIVKVEADRSELTRALREGGPRKTITILCDGKEVDLKLDWEPAATPR